MRVRKKPVVVNATQWDGDFNSVDGQYDYASSGAKFCVECGSAIESHGWIKTLEGGHRVCPNDWIITGIKGERYPCKSDVFEQTYEFVDGITLAPEPASLLELCHNILELARHGDYSNGNTAQGMDEGRVMAARMMADYEQQLKNFEKEID